MKFSVALIPHALLAGAVVPLAVEMEGSCAGDLACTLRAESATIGSTMLQTAHDRGTAVTEHTASEKHDAVEMEQRNQRKTTAMPLKTRLDTLEKESTDLQERISAVEEGVGLSAAGAGGLGDEVAPALIGRKKMRHDNSFDIHQIAKSDRDNEKGKQDFTVPLSPELEGDDEDAEGDADEGPASLLEESSVENDADEKLERDDSVKDRVAALEANTASMKHRVSALENQVIGQTYDSKEASLLQKAATAQKVNENGNGRAGSLKARIVSLEDDTDSLRTRVSSLEHDVSG